MCRRTASASRWWWTRGWSCAGPSSTGWTSPTSTTLSKGSQKTRRKAGKVKLSFSQKQPHFKEIMSSHLWRQRNLDRRRTRVWSSSGGEILAYFIFNSRVLEFKTHATLTHLGSWMGWYYLTFWQILWENQKKAQTHSLTESKEEAPHETFLHLKYVLRTGSLRVSNVPEMIKNISANRSLILGGQVNTRKYGPRSTLWPGHLSGGLWRTSLDRSGRAGSSCRSASMLRGKYQKIKNYL